MTLSEQLKEKQKQSIKNRSKIAANQMIEATLNLKESGIEDRAKETGDIFDNAVLLDLKSKEVDLYNLLKGRPAIISIYRGSWCPYCNLELREYESLLSKKENKDVVMFAISPEKPDVTLVEQDVSKLNFTVLSDVDNKLAIKLGIMFHLPKTFQLLYGESYG
ncbi:MAG: peroxiredoxin-like family protein [Sphaerochaetaceae bacterium]